MFGLLFFLSFTIYAFITTYKSYKIDYINVNYTKDSDRCICLNYKTWKNIFLVNPHRFSISNVDNYFNLHLIYKTDDYQKDNKFFIVRFESFFDYLRIISFYHSYFEDTNMINSKDSKTIQNNNLRIVLEETQNEIDKLKKKSNEEILQAATILQDVKSEKYKINNDITLELIKKGE